MPLSAFVCAYVDVYVCVPFQVGNYIIDRVLITQIYGHIVYIPCTCVHV